MADTISLPAQRRNHNMTPKALRRAQVIPGVVYGHAFEATSVQFDYLVLARVTRQAGTSRLVSVVIEGMEKPQDAFLREVQRDPVSGRILHVDLYAVVADERVRNFVPIVQQGEAPAAELGAFVAQTLHSLEIECLPRDMPASIAVDLSLLTEVGSHITVADLAIPENVTVLGDPRADVVTVSAPSTALAELEAEEELLVGAVEAEAVEEAEEEGAEGKPGESESAEEGP